MIKFENIQVGGFDAAIRGMRNPLNSWGLSDSFECKHYEGFEDWHDVCEYENCPMLKTVYTGPNEWHTGCTAECGYIVGKEDLKLMRKLAHAGDDHGKFARFINVTVDITAPLYWWKEFDTYKVGTVSNSCSTMHKLMEKNFTIDDFSFEKVKFIGDKFIRNELEIYNTLRNAYLNFDEYEKNGIIPDKLSDKKDVWYALIQILPSSYNQRRTVQMNYQVLNRIYHARKNHKLDEWLEFCAWIEKLPYFKAIYLGDEK